MEELMLILEVIGGGRELASATDDIKKLRSGTSHSQSGKGAKSLGNDKKVPENLEENGYIFREMIIPTNAPKTTADHPGLAVLTSVPPIHTTGEKTDPNSHTVWITCAESKARYFAKGWPKPVPKIPNKVVVKETDDDMGLGVFATRDIKQFELVLVERPYLVYPKGIGAVSLTDKATRELTKSQYFQLGLIQAEKLLERVMKDWMTEEARKGYMELANSHKHDGSGPIDGILRTNGYAVMFGDKMHGFDEDFYRGYSAVSRIGSRLNHSCISNVSVGFDAATFTICFKAKRDIKAGSQIFTSYTQILQSKADRQAALAPYEITECKCRACVNATPQSDKLRQVCLKMIWNWRNQSMEVWPKDPKLNESVLTPLLEMKKRMEEEGLDDEKCGYPLLYQIMHRVYLQVHQFKFLRHKVLQFPSVSCHQ
ncbi:hypothetical protein H1R20_g10415, partial [Candolleomyces eurysporus]